jgi:hypothetical protein
MRVILLVLSVLLAETGAAQSGAGVLHAAPGGGDGIPRVRVVAPVERVGFTRLTSCDSLQAFVRSLSQMGVTRVRTIATSKEGRAVTACQISSSPVFGQDTTKLRCLLFAQQHGDEPSGKEALTLLLAKIANGDLDPLLARMDILIVPQMNPDGAELRQRRTADGKDLNRTHLLLSAAEPAGLHRLFFDWWPQVTLDIHEYSPFSTSWSSRGYIKRADVQLGMLTNLNSPRSIRDYQRQEVFPYWSRRMAVAGYAFSEYIVGSPDERIRFSTTEPNDGRQSFGLLGTLSFIQEGRGGRTLEENLERRALSQLASVEALLSFCAANEEEIRARVAQARGALPESAGEEAVLCMDHFPGGKSIRIPVQNVSTGRDSLWNVEPLDDAVKPLVTRAIPHGYVVPRDLAPIREILDRNRVAYTVVEKQSTVPGALYRIESVVPDTLEAEWHPKPTLSVTRGPLTLRPGDLVITTAQRHALFLVTLLEPESMWGLVKYAGFEYLWRSKVYPISLIP